MLVRQRPMARSRGAVRLSMALAAGIALSGCVGGGGLPIGPAPAGSSASGSSATGSCPISQPPALPAGQTRTVTITTAKGKIVIKVDANLAPIATGNFIALATCGWYNGVVFHRLVPSFVIQGGDGQYGRVGADGKLPPQTAALAGSGHIGYTIDDEPVPTTYVRGTVAMARTALPHSEEDQFFIVLDDSAAQGLTIANNYAVLGKVTSGMDVVDAIANMPNSGDPANSALDPLPMTTVTVGP